MTVKYFAYGSNMLTSRLRERAPSARFVATGHVDGRRLTFHKVGKDGSGKADAEHTGDARDRVHGVVFEITAADKKSLDKFEGKGYAEEVTRVLTTGGTIESVTYIAVRKDSALRPTPVYKALVVAGAVEHHLPPDYVERLRAVATTEDPGREETC